MTLDSAHFEEIQGRLRGVLTMVDEGLPPVTVALVDEMIDANECGVALEIMSEMLSEANAQIEPEVLEIVGELVGSMGLDRENVERLRGLVRPRSEHVPLPTGSLRATHVLHAVVRDALRALSDEDYQRQVWLAEHGPEVGSLAEAVERLFDDSGLGDALGESSTTYLPETDSALSELDSLLKQMDDRRPPAVILSDPRLRRVRELAATALNDPELRQSGP